MTLDKFLVSKHRYGDGIYSTIQMLDNDSIVIKYIIILNTSLYVNQGTLDTIIGCINDFLKDHSIILISYNTTGIIKYYSQGECVPSLLVSGNVNQIIPFELLSAVIEDNDNIKILFITSNIFNNHFKNYDDYDMIYKIINKIKYKANCTFYTFLTDKSLDRNNRMKFLSLGNCVQANVISMREFFLLQLIEYQSIIKNIGRKYVEFYDTNNVTIGFMKYNFKSFAELEHTDNLIINSTILSKLSLQIHNLKENKISVNSLSNYMGELSTHNNDMINDMMSMYAICNNYDQKPVLLDYYIIKFAQCNNHTFLPALSQQYFEKKLSFVKCYYGSDHIHICDKIYSTWFNSVIKKNLKNNNDILIPLYLNKDHYMNIKSCSIVPDIKILLDVYLQVLLSDIINNNIIMKSNYFSEYTKFLRYYLEEYFKTNSIDGYGDYYKILLIIFKLHTKKNINITLSIFDLDWLFKSHIKNHILPLHDKTIIKLVLLLREQNKLLVNFELLVKNWNYTLHKQRYKEYMQFKKKVKDALYMIDDINIILDIIKKFYKDIFDIMLAYNYFLGKYDNSNDLYKLFGLYSWTNAHDAIEFMLCSNINSIKKNYVAHISIYWTIYFMKLYNIIDNEIDNEIDTATKMIQTRSLEDIKYAMLNKA